jgi:hypothetical protein
MAKAGITPEAFRAAYGRLHRAGVRLVLGSDAGIGVPSRTGSSQRRS